MVAPVCTGAHHTCLLAPLPSTLLPPQVSRPLQTDDKSDQGKFISDNGIHFGHWSAASSTPAVLASFPLVSGVLSAAWSPRNDGTFCACDLSGDFLILRATE